MFHEIELGREFFEGLMAIDAAILARAGREACRFCGGPLHRGDYARKPRGGVVGAAAEAFARRFSLCCGREGCRRRATPPSVRFLGRRVYVCAVVVVASVVALAALRPKPAGRPAMPAREQELLADNERLRRENERLTERTETTDRLLEVASGFLRGRVQASGRTPRPKKATATKPIPDEPPDSLLERAKQMREIGLTATLTAAVLGMGASTFRCSAACSRD
jgi:hypothetical protein